jgi:hypothetical protein
MQIESNLRNIRDHAAQELTQEAEWLLRDLATFSKLEPTNPEQFLAQIYTMLSVAVYIGFKRSASFEDLTEEEWYACEAVCLHKARSHLTNYPIPDEEISSEVMVLTAEFADERISLEQFADELWRLIVGESRLQPIGGDVECGPQLLARAIKKVEVQTWVAYPWLALFKGESPAT